jgi:diguanylate cyclase (GGDEF)-like protein
MARMLIDEAELAHRKELLSFTDTDVSFLMLGGPFVMPHIEGILDEFYRVQLAIPEVSAIIGANETLRRLRSAQNTYIESLFSGTYDESYASNRLRIGLVHKQSGVQPKYYFSAMKTLQDILRNVLAARIADIALAAGVNAALDKLLYLDTGLIIDAYLQSNISELERTTAKARAYTARMKKKVAEIELLSKTDSLTGLLNRRAFLDELRKEFLRAKRHDEQVSLLYLDVDDFKSINDKLGHSEGDERLKLIGRTLRRDLRETDFAGRLGGDEFCVTFSGATLGQARLATDRFLARLQRVTISTVSIGIACTGPVEFVPPETLIAEADRAMIEAKSLRAQRRIESAAQTPTEDPIEDCKRSEGA